MKNLQRLIMVIAVAVAVAFTASADCKIDAANLPAKAQTFIKKHFAKEAIRDCEQDGNRYEVELKNGVDIEFSAQGELIKIDAGKKTLSLAMLKEILPAKAYDELKSRNVIDDVEEVELRGAGIKVELRKMLGDDEYRFDKDGNLLYID